MHGTDFDRVEDLGLPLDSLGNLAKRLEKVALTASSLAAARREVDTHPTEAQKDAGNYRKGHVSWNGLDVAIENPKGSVRSGVGKDGKPWSTTMAHDYGYIKGSVGADKDHVDVFLGPHLDSDRVYIINQVDPQTREFDEHKVVLGARSRKEARRVYLANYEPGWKGLGSMRRKSLQGLKNWILRADMAKQAGDQRGAEKLAFSYAFTGDVQGTGLRKTFHQILDKYDLPGVSYNDARSGQVFGTIDSEDAALRQKVLGELARRQKRKKKVQTWGYQPLDKPEKLVQINLDDKALARMFQRQGFTTDLERPDSAAYRRNWVQARYHLKPDDLGNLAGFVPRLAHRQLRGLEPIYEHQVTTPENYGPIYWQKQAGDDDVDEIKIPLPHVRQQTDYTCGVAALESVNDALGTQSKGEMELAREAGTSKEDGTSPEQILAEAERLGLQAKIHRKMTIDQLKTLVDADHPVIVDIQAWGDPEKYPELNDGHYVVAIGYDDANLYFMDPSIEGEYGEMTYEEFGKRWFDREHPGDPVNEQLGIEIWQPGKTIPDEDKGRTEKVALQMPPRMGQPVVPLKGNDFSAELQRMAEALSKVRKALQRHKRHKRADDALAPLDFGRYGDIGQFAKDELLDYVIQEHNARRAGKHHDVRFGDKKRGLLSWATRKDLPGPGGKIGLFQQPLHRHNYMHFQGTLSGYGAGTVRQKQKGQLRVVNVAPGHIHLATVDDVPQHYALVRPKIKSSKRWLMVNVTPPPEPVPDAPDPIKLAEDEKVPTVAVDLDGTLAKNLEPFDPQKIGPPRPGAYKWMRKFRQAGARIVIFTVRGDKAMVGRWLRKHHIPFDYINENPDQPEDSSGKVIADVYWDDRAVSAKGPIKDTAPEVLERLKTADDSRVLVYRDPGDVLLAVQLLKDAA